MEAALGRVIAAILAGATTIVRFDSDRCHAVVAVARLLRIGEGAHLVEEFFDFAGNVYCCEQFPGVQCVAVAGESHFQIGFTGIATAATIDAREI